MTTREIAFRLVLAAVLGGLIGFDRERHTWVAGLRTHMLVCVGAALAMIVSAFGFSDVLDQGLPVALDPSRIAAQVISGVGFLGAGTIMFLHRDHAIHGLTTAAGLWTVAAIGLAAGGGMYAAAVITTAMVWAILVALKPLERRFFLHRTAPQVRVDFAGRASLSAIEQVLAGHDLPARTAIVRCAPEDDDEGDQVSLEFAHTFERSRLSTLADALRDLPGVKAVTLDANTRPTE